VFFCGGGPGGGAPIVGDGVLSRHRAVLERSGERLADGQPFLLRPDGFADVRVNQWFESDEMLVLRASTWRKYAYSLLIWLNFLTACGVEWDAASRRDQHAFKTWRMTDPRNPRAVRSGTYHHDLIAVSQFYAWAGIEFGIVNPVTTRRGRFRARNGERRQEPETKPSGSRDRDVKWFDPAGYRRYRDVGLLGLNSEGLDDPGFRGRNPQRDGAFADGLFGTGLRLQEWGSVLSCELPEDDPGRYYMVCNLAGETAKGGFGRRYWLPRRVLTTALSYFEGERASAVRRARSAGRYEKMLRDSGTWVIAEVNSARRVTLSRSDGARRRVSLDSLSPGERRKLLVKKPDGMEPAAVWLNEDGLPRDPHGWSHTFDTANRRLERLGLLGFAGAAHMLRHSFALRWYSVGRLMYDKHFAHLTEDELRDYRAQFGNAWDLVQMLLGHRSPETTREIYLEPFRSLDMELLFVQAAEETVPQLMAALFAGDRRILGDPLAAR